MAESEAIERTARVVEAAERVWNDRDDAREWVSTPHPELDGQTPLVAARTDQGARRVEALLEKLCFGLPV